MGRAVAARYVPSRTRRPSAGNRPPPAPRVEWPRGRLGLGAPDRSGRFHRLRLELDVAHEHYAPEPLHLLAPLTSLLHEREVEDAEDLLTLSAQVLRGLAAGGFTTVDHWEARPGGWLPLPEPTHRRLAEPLTHLLRALSNPAWAPIAGAREFAVRLSESGPRRLDVVVRRRHREQSHAVSLDLRGTVLRGAADALVGHVHAQVPLVRAEVTEAVPWEAAHTKGRALRIL